MKDLLFRHITVITMAFIIGLLTLWALERNKVWQSEVLLWGDTFKKSPNKVRVLSNYGASLILEHRFVEAIPPLLNAIELSRDDPTYYYAWFNLSVAYEQIWDLQNAYKYAHKAAVLKKDTNTLTQLGIVLKKIGWKPPEKKG